MNQYKILFICLGNICRSPMAETIMAQMVNKCHLDADIEVDSAGIIGFHAGEQADIRMRQHAKKRGYNITHISRQVRTSDYEEFDMLVSMDDSVHDRLLENAPTIEHECKIIRMTDFCLNKIADHVPDPYYGGSDGFEHVIDLLEDACNGLLKHIIKVSMEYGVEVRHSKFTNISR